MAESKLTLTDWLDDLCVRFIINLPEEDLSSVPRICFQIEEAQWYYEDFIRPLDPSLPSMSLRSFCMKIFQHCPLLSSFSKENHIAAFDQFLQYKTRVPVRGAIMLNEALDAAVLVKGWKKGASWSFPRGKINKDEDDLDCAIREVYEETGFDLRKAGLAPSKSADASYVQVNMREQQIRLYIFRNVPIDSEFQPRTRKEISKIEWFPLSALPAFRKGKPQQQQQPESVQGGANNNNNFYMVAPFLVPLRKWVKQQKAQDARRPAPPLTGAYLQQRQPQQQAQVDESATEDDTGATMEPVPEPVTATQVAANCEDATEELRRLLKLQPPTQGIQVAPPTTASTTADLDSGKALLAMLQGKPSAPHQRQSDMKPPVSGPPPQTAPSVSMPAYVPQSTIHTSLNQPGAQTPIPDLLSYLSQYTRRTNLPANRTRPNVDARARTLLDTFKSGTSGHPTSAKPVAADHPVGQLEALLRGSANPAMSRAPDAIIPTRQQTPKPSDEHRAALIDLFKSEDHRLSPTNSEATVRPTKRSTKPAPAPDNHNHRAKAAQAKPRANIEAIAAAVCDRKGLVQMNPELNLPYGALKILTRPQTIDGGGLGPSGAARAEPIPETKVSEETTRSRQKPSRAKPAMLASSPQQGRRRADAPAKIHPQPASPVLKILPRGESVQPAALLTTQLTKAATTTPFPYGPHSANSPYGGNSSPRANSSFLAAELLPIRRRDSNSDHQNRLLSLFGQASPPSLSAAASADKGKGKEPMTFNQPARISTPRSRQQQQQPPPPPDPSSPTVQHISLRSLQQPLNASDPTAQNISSLSITPTGPAPGPASSSALPSLRTATPSLRTATPTSGAASITTANRNFLLNFLQSVTQ